MSLRRSVQRQRETSIKYNSLICPKTDEEEREDKRLELLEQSKLGLRKTAKCFLCEHEYTSESLPYTLSVKTVLELKRSWGAITDTASKKLPPSRIYDKGRICRFCGQFFDIYPTHHEVYSNVIGDDCRDLEKQYFDIGTAISDLWSPGCINVRRPKAIQRPVSVTNTSTALISEMVESTASRYSRKSYKPPPVLSRTDSAAALCGIFGSSNLCIHPGVRVLAEVTTKFCSAGDKGIIWKVGKKQILVKMDSEVNKRNVLVPPSVFYHSEQQTPRVMIGTYTTTKPFTWGSGKRKNKLKLFKLIQPGPIELSIPDLSTMPKKIDREFDEKKKESSFDDVYNFHQPPNSSDPVLITVITAVVVAVVVICRQSYQLVNISIPAVDKVFIIPSQEAIDTCSDQSHWKLLLNNYFKNCISEETAVQSASPPIKIKKEQPNPMVYDAIPNPPDVPYSFQILKKGEQQSKTRQSFMNEVVSVIDSWRGNIIENLFLICLESHRTLLVKVLKALSTLHINNIIIVQGQTEAAKSLIHPLSRGVLADTNVFVCGGSDTLKAMGRAILCHSANLTLKLLRQKSNFWHARPPVSSGISGNNLSVWRERLRSDKTPILTPISQDRKPQLSNLLVGRSLLLDSTCTAFTSFKDSFPEALQPSTSELLNCWAILTSDVLSSGSDFEVFAEQFGLRVLPNGIKIRLHTPTPVSVIYVTGNSPLMMLNALEDNVTIACSGTPVVDILSLYSFSLSPLRLLSGSDEKFILNVMQTALRPLNKLPHTNVVLDSVIGTVNHITGNP